MRKRLSLLVLAVTSMVVIAFVIPLIVMVRGQAESRALNRSQQTAQAVAAGLAVAESLQPGVGSDVIELVIAAAGDSTTTVFFEDGTTVGADAPDSEALTVAAEGRALTADAEGGVEVLVPVTGAGRTLIVRTFASSDALSEGVLAASIALGLLGLLLVTAAVALADRLGRNLVRPVTELASTARAMAAGDLDARVVPAGPPEIADAGEAFNNLAGRLDDLIAAERESLADLSHRLRTPLTALRLQVEMLDDGEASAAMLDDVDRLDRQVDGLITEARRRSPVGSGRSCDAATVVRRLGDFWAVLAEEQGRSYRIDVPAHPVLVPVAEDEMEAAVDALLENVFSHTEAGTAYRITLTERGRDVLLAVEDDGAGFPDDDVIARGASGAGSTGLGLDIARRAAERAGGGVTLHSGPARGARVEMRLPRA